MFQPLHIILFLVLALNFLIFWLQDILFADGAILLVQNIVQAAIQATYTFYKTSWIVSITLPLPILAPALALIISTLFRHAVTPRHAPLPLADLDLVSTSTPYPPHVSPLGHQDSRSTAPEQPHGAKTTSDHVFYKSRSQLEGNRAVERILGQSVGKEVELEVYNDGTPLHQAPRPPLL